MFLISRVKLVSMILPVALSTLSNLLVGYFSLVDSLLIVVLFRPPKLRLWKINVHVSEPSSIIGKSKLA